MKRWIWALVTVGVLSVGPATASAQVFGGYGDNGCGVSYGGPSQNVGYGGYAPDYNVYSPGYGGGINVGYGGLNLSFGGGSRWHNTTHYDYHPGSFQRHRFHYDYVPGHYDIHRSGHRH
jgi:hypothetical protein